MKINKLIIVIIFIVIIISVGIFMLKNNKKVEIGNNDSNQILNMKPRIKLR